MRRCKHGTGCLLLLGLLGALPLASARSPVTPVPHPQPAADPALQRVLDGAWRTPAARARDVWRHPAQTLTFFGLRPDQTVIEITPGGGWYAEILAPYLRAQGHYIAALVDPQTLPAGQGRDYQQRARSQLQQRFTAQPSLYDKVRIVAYAPSTPVFGADGSADLVLTFRNVHNWRAAGQAEAMFAGFQRVLKSGGVLGVVEHRANADVAADDRSGYVGQAQVIALAEAAGLRFVGGSEINANPRDSKDYRNGVWTLPPTNQHPPADAARYRAIGESDRMTLKFVKP